MKYGHSRTATNATNRASYNSELLKALLDGAEMVRFCGTLGLSLMVKHNRLYVYNNNGVLVHFTTCAKDSLTNDEKSEWLSNVLEQILSEG